MTGEYETLFNNGDCSDHFKKIMVPGPPITGNKSKTKSSKEWTEKIQHAIKQKFKNECIRDECNLYATFHLEKNRHKKIDLDNLLKLALDAMGEHGIKFIENDNLIRGIKVFKEPVNSTDSEGFSFQFITTKTFTIESVVPIEGEKFMPDYWKYPMQYITAIDSQGNNCTFIDNQPGLIFIASTEDKDSNKRHLDAVPGYDWESKIELDISGCMVFKRQHLNKETGISKDFFWLQKWAWW
ncbi:MAG: RusA family crossover junction endodeoxyribonuclease [Actinomycetia bacterium]|nr:RusA family crossover junction endodeoxyribonuclease [Actinomycetes bacterium]